VKKVGPHRVVIERGQNGVSVTAHHDEDHMMGPGGPQPSFFNKLGPAKKHVATHMAAMMPAGGSDQDGDEGGEQGSGAPVAV
jgi:hypothetical protein